MALGRLVERRRLRCPYCGAEIEAPATVSTIVCPYCGTAFHAETLETVREHYTFEVTRSSSQAFLQARRVAARQFAAPQDLEEEASLERAYLHYVPFYLYHAKARASCPGNPEAGLEDKYATRLAMNPPGWLPKNYPFPVRGRRFFEPRRLRGGRYHEPSIDPEGPLEEIRRLAVDRALGEARNECSNPSVADETKWEGLVHHPFWEISYRYRGESFHAVVDAAGGEVLEAEYPLGARETALARAGAAASTAASLVIGGLLAGGLGLPLLGGALGGLAAGLPALLAIGRASSGSRRLYRGSRYYASRWLTPY